MLVPRRGRPGQSRTRTIRGRRGTMPSKTALPAIVLTLTLALSFQSAWSWIVNLWSPESLDHRGCIDPNGGTCLE